MKPIKECINPTMDDINYYWGLFDKYKETAEQHEFVTITLWDIKLVPLYNDLKENWNEDHARIFLKGLDRVFEQFGIKVPKRDLMTALNIPDDLKLYLISEELENLGSFNRLHYVFRFNNNYGASIIKGYGTYGNENDNWELATIYFDNDEYELVYGNSICDDDVVGDLADKEVIDALYKIESFK